MKGHPLRSLSFLHSAPAMPYPSSRLAIIPLRNTVRRSELEALAPDGGKIVACDFYVEGAEAGTPESGGLRLGRVLNVDHHAPVARMRSRAITSTVLATAWAAARSPQAVPPRIVVINHTDCDSICASAIMLGRVAATPDLVQASIAADHTGADHPVANCLQALDEGRRGTRTSAEYEESLENLHRLLAGRPLTQGAAAAVAQRATRRAEARAAVASDQMAVERHVAFGQFAHEIDGAFFPALLPQAVVVMVASPHPQNPGRWVVKLRLGAAAPEGLTLHTVGVTTWDPSFGGRWNAGSNKRDGGTGMDPAVYRAHLERRLLEIVDVPQPATGHATGHAMGRTVGA